MKGLLILIVIIVIGIVGWKYFKQPPNPQETRATAQASADKTATYWLDAAVAGRVADMDSVSIKGAQGRAQNILDQIRLEAEKARGTFDSYDTFSMGGGGALKAVLSSSQGGGILMHLTIRVEQQDGKYWIAGVTPE